MREFFESILNGWHIHDGRGSRNFLYSPKRDEAQINAVLASIAEMIAK